MQKTASITANKLFIICLADHGKKLGIPSHTLQGMLDTAHIAWQRCYKKLAKKPKLKGRRNRLTSIPFPDAFKAPVGNAHPCARHRVCALSQARHPLGKLKSGRIVKRASGWYLCLCIDTQPNSIPHVADRGRSVLIQAFCIC